MTIRRPLTATLHVPRWAPVPLWLLAPLAALAALIPAGVAHAQVTVATPVSEASATAPATTTAVETTSVPAPAPPEPAPSSTATSSTPTTSATTTPAPETTTVPAPEVRTQRPQRPTAVTHGHASPSAAKPPKKQVDKGSASAEAKANANAVSPSALTPPLPSTLGGSLSGVPSFFIDSFSIPPFLLPIYQAAGAAYGIPWQVLAAINEVETDYGRDLSVSSAGAEGWMQFLPSTWGQYGVDVNDDGFEDPYNPADAIFGAARYLKAAGGDTDIRAAILAYNHSQAYVNSVLLRARLLGGTPPELLGAITGLTEARFPVYAASHYSDGFPTTEGPSPHTVAGTTIDSQEGAPVIAVQDGRISQISQGGPFGRSVSLTDAYGNTYTYAELGATAKLYPVLEAVEPGPPARPPARAGAARVPGVASGVTAAASGAIRVFREGSENVYLHSLRVGARVIAGTVLGHVGPGLEPHIVFQIRPAGIGAPLIDPKPILDGWVKLQSSSVVKAKGRDPFAKISPTPGQALLESKTQLEQQVPRDHAIHLAACERRLIADGRADRRVLATLAFLAASDLRPTVSARSCAQASLAARHSAGAGASASAFDISAIDGIPVVGPAGETPIAIVAVRKLAALQGVMKPLQIASATRLDGASHTVVLPGYAGVIGVSFTPLGGGEAHAAKAASAGLTPAEWLKLVARLGQVPDPVVSAKPSAAAIPDHSGVAASSAAEGK
jgi:murein DD-endopeptidase MepM/ murein hydrolase activator NlpD